MKQIKIILSSLIIIFACSCNKFLDLTPRGNTGEDKMFEDLQGFKDAMYGVYASLAQPTLYGENMSYGFIDDLAQLYYIPSEKEDPALKLVHSYKYTDQQLLSYTEGIWRSYYKAISYVNNVIKHVELISDKSDYPFIKGEAYGLRAFLHFEVLRLYADNIALNPNATGIPYAYSFNLENKEVFSLKDSYGNILKDLDEAEKLLEKDNAIFSESAPTDYQKARYVFFNKFAVFALKAKVYLWMKDYPHALEYARKVMEHPEFKLSDKYNIAKAKKFPAEKELIWGLSTDKLYPSIYNRFLNYSKGSTHKVRMMRRDVNKIYEQPLFTGNSSDARYTNFILPTDGQFLFTRLLEKKVEVQEEAKAVKGICLLRLPEMYYIAAEASYDSNPTQALAYYNVVRTNRGLREINATEIPTKDAFVAALLKERTKEFWGEGQLFLDYKRLNAKFTTVENKTIEPTKEIFVLPWPKNERDYGNK